MAKRQTCKSGKTRYPDAGTAFRALGRIQERPIDPDRPFDFYRPNGVRSCPRCRGFHLTSNLGKPHQSGKSARNLRVGTYRTRK